MKIVIITLTLALLLYSCQRNESIFDLTKDETATEIETEATYEEIDYTVPRPHPLPDGMDKSNDYNPAPAPQSSNSTEVSEDDVPVSTEGAEEVPLSE